MYQIEIFSIGSTSSTGIWCRSDVTNFTKNSQIQDHCRAWSTYTGEKTVRGSLPIKVLYFQKLPIEKNYYFKGGKKAA